MTHHRDTTLGSSPGGAGWRMARTLHRLPMRDPFRIARPEDAHTATTVVLRIESVGHEGLGEAFPVAYYGETPATLDVMLDLLLREVDGLGPPPSDVESALGWVTAADERMATRIGGHGSAKAGIDIALADAASRAVGVPLWRLLGTQELCPPTDFSLGIDRPELVAERARRAAHFPALKIKLGGPADLETLEAVRGVYRGALRVDANTGWQPEQAAALIPVLERLGVELVEQPFPARQLPRLRWLQERSRLPIVADESAVTSDDLEALVGVVAGVNVKLMKCGGVVPALAMMRRARELGFKVMLGCMEETSVGIAAAATLGRLADWIDLDGNLLLADDPYEGLELGPDCRWRLPDRPGLGVVARGAG
jgi:L-alanine-DL-glutamate epimerase-like enolase superfamily enzyme